MDKNELIKELNKQVKDLSTMVEYLKNPEYSADTFEALHKHIDVYKFTPGEMLDTMMTLVKLYGNDDLCATALDYQKSCNENKNKKEQQ